MNTKGYPGIRKTNHRQICCMWMGIPMERATSLLTIQTVLDVHQHF